MHLLQDWLNKLDTRLDRLEEIQAKNTVSLVEHMRRTQLAEENLEKIRAEFAPIKAHVAAWGVAGKLLGVISTVAATAGAVAKLFGWI